MVGYKQAHFQGGRAADHFLHVIVLKLEKSSLAGMLVFVARRRTVRLTRREDDLWRQPTKWPKLGPNG